MSLKSTSFTATESSTSPASITVQVSGRASRASAVLSSLVSTLDSADGTTAIAGLDYTSTQDQQATITLSQPTTEVQVELSNGAPGCSLALPGQDVAALSTLTPHTPPCLQTRIMRTARSSSSSSPSPPSPPSSSASPAPPPCPSPTTATVRACCSFAYAGLPHTQPSVDPHSLLSPSQSPSTSARGSTRWWRATRAT